MLLFCCDIISTNLISLTPWIVVKKGSVRIPLFSPIFMLELRTTFLSYMSHVIKWIHLMLEVFLEWLWDVFCRPDVGILYLVMAESMFLAEMVLWQNLRFWRDGPLFLPRIFISLWFRPESKILASWSLRFCLWVLGWPLHFQGSLTFSFGSVQNGWSQRVQVYLWVPFCLNFWFCFLLIFWSQGHWKQEDMVRWQPVSRRFKDFLWRLVILNCLNLTIFFIFAECFYCCL